MVFGVRHFSPAASLHLRAALDRQRPKAVLVEGPSDVTQLIALLTDAETQPPVAVMAYAAQPPVRSLLLPYADYSPELTALRWASENGAEAKFIDLPTGVFLALSARKPADDQQPTWSVQHLYRQLAAANGYETFDDYWEAAFEHNSSDAAYRQAVYELGQGLRDLQPVAPENLVREAHMRRKIETVRRSGVADQDIAVVCGAYHASVLTDAPPMSDSELDALPRLPVQLTALPYTYLRLSSRTGYEAGIHSPRYFELLWSALRDDTLQSLPVQFFAELAQTLRQQGRSVSAADVLEATRLSLALASVRNQRLPTLDNLRAAAVTCLGQGQLAPIAEALNRVEVGTAAGSLPTQHLSAPIQQDFLRQCRQLTLERYRTPVAKELQLDLRENTAVKRLQSRWLDLNRFFFLNRLAALGVPFGKRQQVRQTGATWKEVYALQWTPDTEIALAENALRGETIDKAAREMLAEQLQCVTCIADITAVVESAAACGLPDALRAAAEALRDFTGQQDSLEGVAEALHTLSMTVKFGGLRHTDTTALEPLLSQLFVRATGIATTSCGCDDNAAAAVQKALWLVQEAAVQHPSLCDGEAWRQALHAVADGQSVNALLAGTAAALLLERDGMDETRWLPLMTHRLSSATLPADSARWFEGLVSRNHYALLSLSKLWQALDDYMAALEEDAFVPVLVILRRALAGFSPAEKRMVCQQLAQLRALSADQVEDAVSQPLSEQERQWLDEVSTFDFDGF